MIMGFAGILQGLGVCSGGRRCEHLIHPHIHHAQNRILHMLQGLEVCSAGRALARPHRLELEQWVEEQAGWAASAEKTSAQYLEAFAFRRGKAMEGAGAGNLKEAR